MAQRYGWLTSAGVAESNVDGAKASDSAESVVPYVEKAKQAVSDNDRAKAWQNLQNAMNQYSPVIPIVNDAGLIAAGKNVTGIYYDTVNGVDFTALT